MLLCAFGLCEQVPGLPSRVLVALIGEVLANFKVLTRAIRQLNTGPLAPDVPEHVVTRQENPVKNEAWVNENGDVHVVGPDDRLGH